jgi:membrane protease YdiL (CAAX protease family)
VDDSAEAPITHEPLVAPQVPAATDAQVLSRYRPLQIGSIVLVLAGLAGLLLGVNLAPLTGSGSGLPTSEEAAQALAAVSAGALALVVGLIANAARAMVVRERLPAQRYRGPSIIVLLLIATVVTVAVVVPYFAEIQRFTSGEPTSIPGALVILTSTQAGLVAVAVLFVALPNALAGVRLLPSPGAMRSILIGLGAAIPAWIGAALLGYALARLLELFGRRPEAGVVDQAIGSMDPTVLILAIVLIAPIAEEIFFRGVVFSAWLREYGERRAYLGSALLFATIHVDTSSADALIASGVTVAPVILGLGLALAIVYHRTGSLAASMALHAGFNGISLTLALLARLLGFELPT